VNTAPHHVIFGTGAIGLATLDALLRRGERVRLVNRGGSARVPDDVEVVAGDAADPAFTTTVTRGARVVYQTLNPPYARLAVLGEHPDSPGQVWHLPNDPDTRTTRQLVDTVYRLADQPHSRLRQIQPLLVRLAALTNRTLRELLEMRYQFDEPFIVDSSKIAATLGVHATPIDRALAETLATYRTRDSRATAPSTRAQ